MTPTNHIQRGCLVTSGCCQCCWWGVEFSEKALQHSGKPPTFRQPVCRGNYLFLVSYSSHLYSKCQGLLSLCISYILCAQLCLPGTVYVPLNHDQFCLSHCSYIATSVPVHVYDQLHLLESGRVAIPLCVHACVRACVRVCVRVCMHVCTFALWVSSSISKVLG